MIGGLGFERNVSDLVGDQQRVAAEANQFGLQLAGVMRLGQHIDPVRGGGEQDSVPGSAGPDGQADRSGSCRCRVLWTGSNTLESIYATRGLKAGLSSLLPVYRRVFFDVKERQRWRIR